MGIDEKWKGGRIVDARTGLRFEFVWIGRNGGKYNTYNAMSVAQ